MRAEWVERPRRGRLSGGLRMTSSTRFSSPRRWLFLQCSQQPSCCSRLPSSASGGGGARGGVGGGTGSASERAGHEEERVGQAKTRRKPRGGRHWPLASSCSKKITHTTLLLWKKVDNEQTISSESSSWSFWSSPLIRGFSFLGRVLSARRVRINEKKLLVASNLCLRYAMKRTRSHPLSFMQ